jgi:serine/threonine-protein kinase
MAKKPPSKIGRYKIVGELGRGAMGVVYKASDPSLDRVVALKTILLSDDMEGREDYRKRFMLEAKAAGKLTHPSIVTTYEFGEEGDVAYMAMELLEGTDLRQCLKDGALSTVEAVEVAAQVADGLGFAHERGVVHRDIKPGNIMLLERGQAKIMDFGIARMRSEDHKTRTGVVLGTPRFMSPEQIAGAAVDHRSDIFSLGSVLYEMLTGAPLFAGEDPSQIAHNVANLEHVPPSRTNPQVTSMLDFVVARALKKDPAQRYQDAYEMASDLRACLGEVRERHAAAVRSANEADGTRTLRMEPGAPPAVAPGAVAPDTRLPVSPRIDSAAALKRLESPSRADRRAFAAAPRAPGVVARLTRDEGPKRLLGAATLAAIAAALVTYL